MRIVFVGGGHCPWLPHASTAADTDTSGTVTGEDDFNPSITASATTDWQQTPDGANVIESLEVERRANENLSS